MLTSFDLSMTEEEIDAAILDGHYVLQAYATTHWLDHVKEGIRDDTDSTDFKDLCQKIWKFLARRSNQTFDRKSAKEIGVLELKHLEKQHKDIYRELCYINSSLASELPESLKAPKKNSKSLLHLPCPGKLQSQDINPQNPETTPPERSLFLSTVFEVFHCVSGFAQVIIEMFHFSGCSLVFCFGFVGPS